MGGACASVNMGNSNFNCCGGGDRENQNLQFKTVKTPAETSTDYIRNDFINWLTERIQNELKKKNSENDPQEMPLAK